jgi:spermidine synthase
VRRRRTAHPPAHNAHENQQYACPFPERLLSFYTDIQEEVIMLSGKWVIEFRGASRSNMYPIEKTRIHTSSQYQDILLTESSGYGMALFLDGIPQSSEIDEHVYHETLMHPALVASLNARTVFISGGGEGAVLREALKHNTVEKVIMVDIDDVMTSIAREHMQQWHQGAFDDPRVEVINDDARAYLERTTERFDCIIGDLPDPLEGGPAAELFTDEFFALVKSRLNEGGTFAMQAENAEIGWCKAHIAIIHKLRNHFGHVLPYQTFIPFYGLMWGFAVAGDHPIGERLNAPAMENILRERGCLDSMQYYDGETHTHMFSLPKYIRDALENPEVAATLKHALPLQV